MSIFKLQAAKTRDESLDTAALENVDGGVARACFERGITPTPVPSLLTEHLRPWARHGNGASEDASHYYTSLSVTKDSGAVDRSNFRVALELLGGSDNETVVIATRYDSLTGWTKTILVRADAPLSLLLVVGEIARKIEDYPVLDDALFNREEGEERNSHFRSWARPLLQERVRQFAIEAAKLERGDLADMEEDEIHLALDEFLETREATALLVDVFGVACLMGSVTDPAMPETRLQLIEYIESIQSECDSAKRLLSMLGTCTPQHHNHRLHSV